MENVNINSGIYEKCYKHFSKQIDDIIFKDVSNEIYYHIDFEICDNIENQINNNVKHNIRDIVYEKYTYKT